MTDEAYERFLALVEEARDIRYVLYCDGAKVTKSIVEDVLMARHGIDRDLGHSITNYIEYHNLDAFPRRRLFEGRPAPTLADFPEIATVKVEYPRYAQRSKA